MRTERVLACAALVGLAAAACTTDDVDVDPPNNTNPGAPQQIVPITDEALAEYLQFREVPGVVENPVGAPTRYSLDTALVVDVTELSLAKSSSAIDVLQMAGVATATTKIAQLDVLEHFINLESLTITANDVTRLDTTALSKLAVLEMNFNLVGALDLSQNPELVRLRYRASANASDAQRLDQIDLAANPALNHLFLPGHDLRAVDLSMNTMLTDTLDLSENPGPDGDRATPDIVVPAAIFDQVMNRAGVISDAEAPPQLRLVSDQRSISENGGMATLTASLNRMAEDTVTFGLTFGGNAVRGADYTVSTSSLTIGAGETEARAVITAIDNASQGMPRTIEVSATMIVNAQASVVDVTISINDDDLPAMLVLNEVLYDPPGAPDGDANQDGTRDAQEDEFIEIVNVGGMPANVGGYTIYDTTALEADTPRHTVPMGTMLMPNQALVVFGGGSPPTTGAFGGAVVQTANGLDALLNLNNNADQLVVRDADGETVFAFDIGDRMMPDAIVRSRNPDESFTRSPDLTGEFVQHADVVDGVFFSPGTRTDGTSF